MDLNGRWRAPRRRRRPAPRAVGLDTDDDDGRGRRARPLAQPPTFADSDGPLLYRGDSSWTRPPEGRRRWLTLDGIFYQADVWLDGAYLGDPEGYFFPHTLRHHRAVAPRRRARARRRGGLPAAARHRTAKRTITGVFQHWDGDRPDWNPGGIWRPVRVDDTGPVRIDRLPRAVPRRRRPARASVVCTPGSTATSPGRARAHAASTASRGRPARAVAGRRPQRGQLDPRHRRPAAVVAAVARRPAADRRRRSRSSSTR